MKNERREAHPSTHHHLPFDALGDRLLLPSSLAIPPDVIEEPRPIVGILCTNQQEAGVQHSVDGSEGISLVRDELLQSTRDVFWQEEQREGAPIRSDGCEHMLFDCEWNDDALNVLLMNEICLGGEEEDDEGASQRQLEGRAVRLDERRRKVKVLEEVDEMFRIIRSVLTSSKVLLSR